MHPGRVGGLNYRQKVTGGTSSTSTVPSAATLTADVLSLCDAVYVGTPPASHAKLTIVALEAGKHVLLEKPLASNLADADAIVAAADKADAQGLQIGVNIGMRWNQAILEMRQQVTDSKPGFGALRGGRIRLHFMQWPRDWQTQPWCAEREQGGPLREVGTHFITAVMEVFGYGCVQWVKADVTYPDGPEGVQGESMVCGLIKLSNGIELAVDVQCGLPALRDDIYELELQGDQGSAKSNPATKAVSWCLQILTLTLTLTRAPAYNSNHNPNCNDNPNPNLYYLTLALTLSRNLTLILQCRPSCVQ